MATKLKQSPQLGLFDGKVAGGFDRGRRHPLDATSWIDHFPAWLARPEALFAELADLDGWEQRERWMFTKNVVEPRLTAEFPVLADAPVAEVRAIGERLSRHYGVVYDSAWLNLYRDHEDSTGWHVDKAPSRRETSIVPVLSLGATRRFLVRPRDGGPSTVFTVETGDLVVMGGRCQRDWVHAVPKETSFAGARISLNFGSSV